MTYYILLSLAGFLDALGDDWRDRFNRDSRVYRLFDWLSGKIGRRKLWEWYRGTKNGREPKRFLFFIVLDYWHNVKIVKEIVSFCLAPIALFFFVDGEARLAIPHAVAGYILKSLIFTFSYNVLLNAKNKDDPTNLATV